MSLNKKQPTIFDYAYFTNNQTGSNNDDTPLNYRFTNKTTNLTKTNTEDNSTGWGEFNTASTWDGSIENEQNLDIKRNNTDANFTDFDGDVINPYTGNKAPINRKEVNGDPTMTYEGLDQRDAGSLFERLMQGMKHDIQILGQGGGKAIYTDKDLYDEGVITYEDEDNVHVQMAKKKLFRDFLQGSITEADYNKYGLGQMLNKSNLGDEITIPRRFHGNEGKDTTFTHVPRWKHALTPGKRLKDY